MKGKKCPYCGRRISYLTVFHEKRHGVYNCSRCKKESKIKVDNKIFIFFGIALFLVILWVIFWRLSDFYNNLLGIIPPIIILTAFYFCTPFFIKFVALKRFLNFEEKKPEKIEGTEPDTGEFVFNKQLFDEIKSKRTAKTSVEEKIDRIIEEDQSYVPIIENVSEGHASSNAPLKKMSKPEYEYTEPEDNYDDGMRTYIPKKESSDGSRYTANRRL